MSAWDKTFWRKYNTWKSFLEVLCGFKEVGNLRHWSYNKHWRLNKVWKVGPRASAAGAGREGNQERKEACEGSKAKSLSCWDAHKRWLNPQLRSTVLTLVQAGLWWPAGSVSRWAAWHASHLRANLLGHSFRHPCLAWTSINARYSGGDRVLKAWLTCHGGICLSLSAQRSGNGGRQISVRRLRPARSAHDPDQQGLHSETLSHNQQQTNQNPSRHL